MVAARRHPLAKRRKNPAPGAHQADGVAPIVSPAVAVEEHHAVDADAHGIVERDAEPLGHGMQLRMGGDAGAAAGQFLGVALEHRGVPARAAQHVGGEQAADRTADDERAWLGHRLSPSG
jgi:hypothetical protein